MKSLNISNTALTTYVIIATSIIVSIFVHQTHEKVVYKKHHHANNLELVSVFK